MHKQSSYNYFVPYQNKVIYFNALTKKSFLMSPQEHERMQKQFSDPISFELEYPTVFTKFVDWGFFIEETVDELAIFRYRYNKEILFSKECHLIFVLQEAEENLQMIETIKKHLEFLVKKERVTSLCLEWVGENLECYSDSWVHPIRAYAQLICEESSVNYELEYPLLAPRMYQYTILEDGRVYSGKLTTYNNNDQIGILETDGMIRWDEIKRAQQIGHIWFETEMCRTCRHLPLIASACPEFLQKSHGVCLLKSDTIQPDWVVVQEFEMKEV